MTTESSDGDFITLKKRSYTSLKTPVTIRVMTTRGGAESISLTFSAEAAAKFGQGWPRFDVAFNPKTFQLRVRASVSGEFEAHKTPKGERFMLRVPSTKELTSASKSIEPAPHTFVGDGSTLMITVPPSLRRPVTVGEMAERARQAIPAPSFGRVATR